MSACDCGSGRPYERCCGPLHAGAPAPDAEALWPLLAARLPSNAVILLKGSRGTRLERLVPHLRRFAGLPASEPDATHH